MLPLLIHISDTLLALLLDTGSVGHLILNTLYITVFVIISCSVGQLLSIHCCLHTLDIVPLSEGTSLQKRSGMARIVEGFHSLTVTDKLQWVLNSAARVITSTRKFDRGLG